MTLSKFGSGTSSGLFRPMADAFSRTKPQRVRAGRSLRNACFRLRAAVQRHGLVLMYHRIAEPGSDPWDLAVSPENFSQHLDVMKRHGHCVSLGDFVERIDAPDRPKRMMAVTFDDGYRDNLTAGMPALAAQDVPATIFVVSGSVGAGRDFWWDALARVFLTMPVLPTELHLDVAGTGHHWQLGGAATCSPIEQRDLARWSMLGDGARHPRHTIFLAVWRVLNAVPPAQAESLCEAVMAWAGADRCGPASEHILNADELARMSADGLVEIGGHTVTHLPLDIADAQTAEREIRQCRMQLGDIVGRDIQSFSYPFGRIGSATPALVRQAGFTRACTSTWSVAFPELDPFLIPRITVTNMNGDRFAAFLRKITGR